MSDNQSSRSSSSADIVYDDGHDAADVLIAEFDSSQSRSSSGKVSKGGYDAVDAFCAGLDISQRSSSPDIDSNDGCEAADVLCDELSITSSDDERFGSPPRAQTPEVHPFPGDALSSPRRSIPQRQKAQLSPPGPSTPCKNENEARARQGLPPDEVHDEIPRLGQGGEIDKQRWGTDSVHDNQRTEERLAEQIAYPVRRWAESVASSREQGTSEVFSPKRAQDVSTYEWRQFTPVKKRRRSPLSPSQSDNYGVGASSSNLSSSPDHRQRRAPANKADKELKVSHKENGSA